jgi:hypothetical protein
MFVLHWIQKGKVHKVDNKAQSNNGTGSQVTVVVIPKENRRRGFFLIEARPISITHNRNTDIQIHLDRIREGGWKSRTWV